MTPFTAFMAGLSLGLLIVGSAVAIVAQRGRRPKRDPVGWADEDFSEPEFKPRAHTRILVNRRTISL